MLWLLLPLLGGPRATDQPAGAGAGDIKYFSYFGERVLKRSQCIAVAKVDRVTPGGPGSEVVHLVVKDVLKGDRDTTEQLLLASRGDFYAGVEMVIFLEPYGAGHFATYLGRILKSDPDFTAKLRVLRQYLALERLPDDAARAQEVRHIILKNIADTVDWVRWNALRELEHVVRDSPSLLTSEDRSQLSAACTSLADSTFKKTFLGVLARLPERAPREHHGKP